MKEYFHLSPTRNKKSILENGLVPKCGKRSLSMNETTPAIYLFPSRNDLDEALMNWVDTAFYRTPLTVFRVTVPDDFPIWDSEWPVSYEVVSYDPIPSKFLQIISD